MSTTRGMEEALKVAPDTWTVAQVRQLANKFDGFYASGITDAARIARSWGDQSAGGSGAGGEGYYNLADAITRLIR